jgi:hypothetical protein
MSATATPALSIEAEYLLEKCLCIPGETLVTSALKSYTLQS